MFSKFLNFDEMVTPLIIKIIYWIGVVLTVLGGLVALFVTKSVIGGLLTIVLGPIFVRIWCELMIVLFEIHKNLVDINKKTVLPSNPVQPD